MKLLTNCPPSLEKFLNVKCLKWLIAHTLSTMIGESFEYQSSKMAEIVHKLSTMVGEIFEYHNCKMDEIAHTLSTMVGEIFEC